MNYKEQLHNIKTYLLIQNIRKFVTNPPIQREHTLFLDTQMHYDGWPVFRSVVVVERYSTPPFQSRDSLDQSRTVI